MEVLATICFADDIGEQRKQMTKLMKFVEETDAEAGSTVVDLEVDDEYLLIEISKGFHCISIPVKRIKELLE